MQKAIVSNSVLINRLETAIKKRVIKNDPYHVMQRKAYQLKMKNPSEKRKAELKRKIYYRLNKTKIKQYQKRYNQFIN